MDKLIDLFDIATYPQEIINELKDDDSELDYYELDKTLDDFYIKCAHTTRIYDKSTIEQYGLLRPLIVDNPENDRYHINEELKSIIFEPYMKVFDNKEIIKMKQDYDSLLIDDYKKNKNSPLEDYYGQYSVVHFTYDNINRVSVDDFNGYKNFLSYHGGELIDMVTVSPLVAGITKPYVVFFRIKISDLPEQERKDLYNDMNRFYFKKEFVCYPSGYINKDISKDNIIEVKELVVNE